MSSKHDDPDSRPYTEAYVVSAGLRQRLDLAHHLLGFGRQLIVVSGDEGSGRSSLLDAISSESNPAWLVVEMNGAGVDRPARLLDILLDALEPGAAARPSSAEDLEARVCRQLAMMHSDQRTAVLIADDCDSWDDSINALLFRLAHTNNGVGELRIVVSCTRQSGYLEALQASTPQASLLHLIEIPPLEETQLGKIALARGLMLPAATLQSIAQRSTGNAARAVELIDAAGLSPAARPPANDTDSTTAAQSGQRIDIALDDEDEEGDAERPSSELEFDRELPAVLAAPKQNKHAGLQKTAGFMLVVATAIGLTVLTLINRDRERVTVPPPAIEIELPAERPAAPLASIAESTSSMPIAHALPDAPSLTDSDSPQAIEKNVDQVPSDSDEPLATATLTSNNPAPPKNTPAVSPATGAEAEAMRSDEASPAIPLPESPPAIPSAPAPAPAPPAPAPAPAKQPEYDRKWVLTNSDKTHVIQLFGVKKRIAAEGFVKQHRLAGKSAIFELEHRGEAWFVVVFGHYPDREQARRAIAALPAALKASGPWPRSVASLRK